MRSPLSLPLPRPNPLQRLRIMFLKLHPELNTASGLQLGIYFNFPRVKWRKRKQLPPSSLNAFSRALQVVQHFESEEEAHLYTALNLIDDAMRAFDTCLAKQIPVQRLEEYIRNAHEAHINLQHFLSAFYSENIHARRYLYQAKPFLRVDFFDAHGKLEGKTHVESATIFHVADIERRLSLLSVLNQALLKKLHG